MTVTPLAGGVKQDAVEALAALGYGRSEAVKAVLEVALEGMDTETIIKGALRRLL
jgi:Holliday junction DNA helicase RuvA